MARRPRPFGFGAGEPLAGKYEVVEALGAGWEGEVYRVRERGTGIERAAKLFYPERNPRNRTSRRNARKLHKLRSCPIVVQYHTEERIQVGGRRVTMLVSELVEGELLSTFVRRFPGGRLRPFEALHLLYALARGVEPIHELGEYHGDLHSDNVIVARFGLDFELKLIDLFARTGTVPQNRREDICNLVYVFWEALGGARTYAGQPRVVKEIVCGLKRTLILRKFPTVTHLRRHLERLDARPGAPL